MNFSNKTRPKNKDHKKKKKKKKFNSVENIYYGRELVINALRADYFH